MMHGYEQSDPVIVAMKPTNKAGQPVAEPVEARACPWLEQGAGAEGTAGRQSTLRAQNRKRVTQALDRVRQAAKKKGEGTVHPLLHHISLDLLRLAFFALKRDARPGIDGLTWRDYGSDLERNLEDLHARAHRGAYRHCRPGDGTFRSRTAGNAPWRWPHWKTRSSSERPVAVLNAIYEEDFLGFSYGFPTEAQPA